MVAKILKFPNKSSKAGRVTQASTMSVSQSKFGVLQPPMGYDVMHVINNRIVAVQSNSNIAGCYPPIYFDTVSEVWRYIIDPKEGA